MTKKEHLLSVFSSATKAGGGIHTTAELAYMLNEKNTAVFTKFLFNCVKSGIIRRVATGIYESILTPPEPSTAIYKIAKKIRAGVLNYISLESQLSHTGDISQILMDRLTIMTKGRNGTFSTPYGIIEFTHTKKPLQKIAPNLYLDENINMYRANRLQAMTDLKNCNRNIQMLEH